MVEFKAVINDVKTGKSYQVPVAGHHATSLIGKKIGDVVDGIFVSLPGYKLTIAGGSDKAGVPMRADLPGVRRQNILLSDGIGVLPPFQTVFQDRLEGNARNHRRCTFGVNIAVSLIAGQKSVLSVIKHKSIGNGLYRGPDPHLFGDIQGKADHVAIAREAGLPYVYLGYWVPGSRKMGYKAGFSALEIYKGGAWVTMGNPSDHAADLHPLSVDPIAEQVARISLPDTRL